MKGLFEYAAALADWDTDGRVRAVYAANIEALRVLLPDTAAMEREVMAARAAALSDGMPRPDMSDYRCLLQCNWQVILFLRRCGLTFDTQAREREALFSRVACCMLIAGYTDSIRAGNRQGRPSRICRPSGGYGLSDGRLRFLGEQRVKQPAVQTVQTGRRRPCRWCCQVVQNGF